MLDYKSILDNLGNRHRLPVLRQAEAAECGLVCLAMIAAFWGAGFDVNSVRQRFAVSARGMNLSTLIKIGRALGFTSRAVRVDISDLGSLRLPAILHWEFKHFVVLKSVGRRYVIHDPRVGLRHVKLSEIGDKFTGVALEIWPAVDFKPATQALRTDWRALLGNPQGFAWLFTKLLTIGVATQILSLLSPVITQWGIDNVAASGDLDLLSVLAIGLAALIILQSVLSALRGWSISGATARFILNWKMHIFGHMARLPLDYFQLRRVGDITSRYDSVEYIVNIVNDSFVEAVLDSITGVVTITVLFLYSFPLACITLGGAALYLAIRLLRYGTVRELVQQRLLADARENSTLIETIRGMRAIKLFGREQGREQEWVAAAADEANANLALSRTQVLFRLTSNLISGAEQVVVFWLSIRMVTTSEMTIGMVVAFASYRSQFYGSVSGLVDNYISIQMVKLHAHRVADIVEAEPETDTPRGEPSERIGSVSATLSLRDISFRYGQFDAFALRDISMHIGQGESVALVGRSGCGKSTLVALLVGLYKPTAGEILFGGVPLRAIGLEVIRREVAAVMQDDMLFSGTVAQNIASFDADMDVEKVQRSAESACIHDDIMEMAMGYGTLVTDMGTSLSGGQRQRLCIARALYREPKALLMDEATSHLDIETERRLNLNVAELGITRVVVAHRLDTIRSASRLILLDRGEIVADTAHGAPYEHIVDSLVTGERFWEMHSSDAATVSDQK